MAAKSTRAATRRLAFALAPAAALILLATSSPDQATPGPARAEARLEAAVEKVEIDNDQVRVIRIVQQPHTITPMHSHPASVVIPVTDVHFRFVYPDGRTEEVEAKAGRTRWSEPVTHQVENLSDAPSEVIHIEPKRGAGR